MTAPVEVVAGVVVMVGVRQLYQGWGMAYPVSRLEAETDLHWAWEHR